MPVLANRAQERIDVLGLTLKEVAKRTGVSYQAIQFILNGATKRPTCIVALARALETTPEWLLGEDEVRDLAADETRLVARYRLQTPDIKRAITSLLGINSPKTTKTRLKVVR